MVSFKPLLSAKTILCIFSMIISSLLFFPGEAIEIFPLSSENYIGKTEDFEVSGYFTENMGQWDERILFSSRTDFGFAYIESDGISYDLREAHHLLRVSFKGSFGSQPFGSSEMDFPSNFFIGDDPDGWITGARSFKEVTYKDVWPDIDLRYYFNDQGLKYDLVLKENGNPEDIHLDVQGIEGLSITDLEMKMLISDDLSINDGNLIAYSDASLNLPVSFKAIDGTGYGFEIEKNRGEVVTIDPLVYSSVIGSSRGCYPSDLVKDEFNCTYLTGNTNSPDFPNTTGAYDQVYNASDVFVTKLNSSGTGLVFSTFLGGWYGDMVKRIRIDESLNIYVSGETYGPDFPTTPGVVQEDYYLNSDIFISKFNASGDKLLYSTFVGGDGGDFVRDMEVKNGCVYFVGDSHSHDLPGAHGPLGGVHGIAYFSILDPNATGFIDSMVWDGYYGEVPCAIEIDQDGTVVIGGWTSSSDFPVTPHSFQLSKIGITTNGFILRYDPASRFTIFSSLVGECKVEDLLLDKDSNIIYCGYTWEMWGTNAIFPLRNEGYCSSFSGWRDAFSAKMLWNGSSIEWSTLIGGSYNETAKRVHLDQAGNVYLYGETISPDFPVSNGAFSSVFSGESDVFICKFDNNCSDLRYSSYLGGSGEEWAISSVLTDKNNMTLLGNTGSPGFPVTEGSYNTSHDGTGGMFLSVLTMQTLPSEPIELLCRGNDGNISLEWKTPVDDGGYCEISYNIYRSLDRVSWELSNFNMTNTSFIDNEVDYGIEYHYLVRSLNKLGEGSASRTVSNVSTTIPDPPENLRTEIGLREISVFFDTPSFDGGIPVTGFSLYRSERLIANLSPDEDQYTDMDIEQGTQYGYCLTSWNINGESDLSDTVTAVSRDTPSAPRNPYARIIGEEVILTWEEPESFGGLDIKKYFIYRGLDEASMDLHSSSEAEDLLFHDSNILTGVTYHYSISALNDLGESEWTPLVSSVQLTIPGPPLYVNAKGGIGFIDLEWKGPSDDGGSGVEQYRLFHGTSTKTAVLLTTLPGDVTSFRHLDLQENVVHLYYLTAVNEMGESGRSHVVFCQVLGLPSPPRNFTVKPGISMIKLEWRAPLELGSGSIIGYRLISFSTDEDSQRTIDLDQSWRSYEDLDVSRKTIYTYRLLALGEYGTSQPSINLSAVPLSNPDSPVSLEIRPSGVGLMLSWSPPVFDGGLNLTWYSIQRRELGGIFGNLRNVDANTTNYVDNSVQPGIEYCYRILAMNNAGKSEPSEEVHGSTDDIPASPDQLTARLVGDSVLLQWSHQYEGSGQLWFNVYRSDHNLSLQKIAVVDGRLTSFIDLHCEQGESLVYRISAENEIGEGPMRESDPILIPGISENEEKRDNYLRISLFASLLIMIILISGFLIAGRRQLDDDEIMQWEEE